MNRFRYETSLAILNTLLANKHQFDVVKQTAQAVNKTTPQTAAELAVATADVLLNTLGYKE